MDQEKRLKMETNALEPARQPRQAIGFNVENKVMWPCRSSAADRVPGSRVGRICALLWPAREAARPVTIISGHLYDQRGRFAKRWNENSSDTEADAHGAEAGTGYNQCETKRPQCVQQTNM